MTKVNVFDLHAKLSAGGVPIDGVALMQDGTIRLDFQSGREISDEQKMTAQSIIDNYDQAAEDTAKQDLSSSAKQVIAGLPSDDDIRNAKTTDLKDLMLKQNAVIAVLLKKLGLTV